MTAVSVRRISWPREASWKPAARAAESSSSVHPPSGPMASAARGGRFCAIRRSEGIAHRWRVAPLGEHQAEAGSLRGEGLRWLGKFDELRNAEPAGLLGGFQENFLPALRTFGGGREQAFFAASCGSKRNNSRDAEFSGFLDGPFEGVELDDGE